MPIPVSTIGMLLESIDRKLGDNNAAVNAILDKIDAAFDQNNNAFRTEIVTSLPPGDNVIGRVKLTDGTNIAVLDTQGRLRSVVYGSYNIAKIVDGVSVGTSEVYSAVVDAREYDKLLLIVSNTQDVDVNVDVEISPDGSSWFPLRTSIPVAAGDYLILDADAFPSPYYRLRLVASAAPTSGGVDVWAILKQ